MVLETFSKHYKLTSEEKYIKCHESVRYGPFKELCNKAQSGAMS